MAMDLQGDHRRPAPTGIESCMLIAIPFSVGDVTADKTRQALLTPWRLKRTPVRKPELAEFEERRPASVRTQLPELDHGRMPSSGQQSEPRGLTTELLIGALMAAGARLAQTPE